MRDGLREGGMGRRDGGGWMDGRRDAEMEGRRRVQFEDRLMWASVCSCT